MAAPFPKLGETLRRWKALTEEDLVRALTVQQQERKDGRFRLLGEILGELALATPEQIRMALERQGRTIMHCDRCLAYYNVEMADDGAFLCPTCKNALVVPNEVVDASIEDWVSSTADQGEARYPHARFGPYEILGEISRGGMGIIYKAKDVRLDRLLAIKVMRGGSKSSPEAADRFLVEARAVSRLRHPHIIAIHTIGEIDGIDYFAMDYIEGRTLERVRALRSLQPKQVCEIFVAIADALAYAHGKRVLHRDVKPANILVTDDLVPVVIDFGIAKLKDRPSDTAKNEILGSPSYLAPEYIAGSVAQFTESCDVYGVGACLYFALAGRPPHSDPDEIELLRRVALEDPPPIRSVVHGVPRGLARVVMGAVARRPVDRYPSAAAMANDLRRVAEGREPLVGAGPWGRWWRRSRKVILAGLALVASVALVFLSGIYARQRLDAVVTENERREAAEQHARACLDAARAYLELGRPGVAKAYADRAMDAALLCGRQDLVSGAQQVIHQVARLRVAERAAPE